MYFCKIKYHQLQGAVNVLESILFTRRQQQKIHRDRERWYEFKIRKKITEQYNNNLKEVLRGMDKENSDKMNMSEVEMTEAETNNTSTGDKN